MNERDDKFDRRIIQNVLDLFPHIGSMLSLMVISF